MSCKISVLMAIDGLSRQLVEATHCGTYIEPENISEYNKQIGSYLNDQERFEKEGNNGYEYAKKYFDRDVLAKEYFG